MSRKMRMNNNRIKYKGFYISKVTGLVWNEYEQFLFNGGSVKRAKVLIDIALAAIEQNKTNDLKEEVTK